VARLVLFLARLKLSRMHVHTKRVVGPILTINCPACGATGVRSMSYEQAETANLIIRHTTCWIQCGACGEALYTSLPLQQLLDRTPEQLERWIVRYVSLPARLLTILSALLFWTPLLGPALSIASWSANRRQRRGAARLSLILFAIGFTLTALVYLAIWLLDRAEVRKH
jgi:hypothetical protein